MNLAIVLVLAFLVPISGEYLYHQKILKGELLRKYIHICTGTFIAFIPWLISWNYIRAIGILVALVAMVEQRIKVVHLDGRVKRLSFGGFLLPLAAVVCTYLTTNKLYFALAMLVIAYADSLAAIFGQKLKKNIVYKIFGQKKSVYGSLTFLIVSIIVLGIGLIFARDQLTYSQYVKGIILIPLALTFIENVSVYGLDNITVPVVAVGLLNSLS